jgi:hypothetical protein
MRITLSRILANLAQFGAKFGIGKVFLFVFGQNQKSG